MGSLRVDTAYGGDTFVIVDAISAGFDVTPDEARDICVAGTKITAAANEQLGFRHPQNPDIQRISFCQFAKPVIEESGQNVGKNAVVVRPGKVDRSPTGTGVSARLAVLHAKGLAGVGYTLQARSIIDWSNRRGSLDRWNNGNPTFNFGPCLDHWPVPVHTGSRGSLPGRLPPERYLAEVNLTPSWSFPGVSGG